MSVSYKAAIGHVNIKTDAVILTDENVSHEILIFAKICRCSESVWSLWSAV